MSFSLCSLEPYFVNILCLYILVCFLLTLMYIITTKTLKDILYGLLDLIWNIGLRIRQHSLCKRTWPIPTFMKPSACDLKFHLKQVLWSHLSSSTTWSYWSCYFEPVSNVYPWSHLIHGRLWRRSWNCQACMWLSLFNSFIFTLLFVYWYCLILKSKGIWVSIWHSCLLDCYPFGQIFPTLNF